MNAPASFKYLKFQAKNIERDDPLYANIYGDSRALIVCGKYEGRDKQSADYLYGELAPQLPYVLTICEADSLTPEQEEYYNIIAIGTKQSNSYIARLCNDGIITPPDNKDGYRIKICDNPKNNQRQIFILAGGGDNGAFYAASCFINKYLFEYGGKGDQYAPGYSGPAANDFLFTYKLKEVDFEDIPQIAERGIWTWGHVIYDYKRFLNNMAHQRMNIITVWNDTVPINAKEFIEYAHSLGIKVIWGFSMGWGYAYDISDDNTLNKIIADAAENYRDNYMGLGGDGIYFQTFTETKDDSKDGINIAERVAVFVNNINKHFREQFGNIRIQFGLHATSVKEHLDKIGTIDPKIEIVWEDCGSFPYEYNPKSTEGYEETKAFTEQITTLRGENEHFSAVLKGSSTLSWSTFEHQMDVFNMGVWGNQYVKDEYARRKGFWRIKNVLWLKNGELAHEIHEIIREKTKGAATIQYLIEAGVFEEKISLSSAIAAQLMWNSNRKFLDIVYEAGLMSDVEF